MTAPARMSRRLLGAGIALLAAGAYWLNPRSGTAGEVFTGLVPGVGAGGYDVVAYFEGGRPTPGSPSITHAWRGATWRFASDANRDKFVADPERFAPAYGGHCSWAAAQSYLAKGDPLNWRIVDGRLFLNYDDTIQKRWEQDIRGFVGRADANWPALRMR
jgi:hypothetical protein